MVKPEELKVGQIVEYHPMTDPFGPTKYAVLKDTSFYFGLAVAPHRAATATLANSKHCRTVWLLRQEIVSIVKQPEEAKP